jgi:hypothetical protein
MLGVDGTRSAHILNAKRRQTRCSRSSWFSQHRPSGRRVETQPLEHARFLPMSDICGHSCRSRLPAMRRLSCSRTRRISSSAIACTALTAARSVTPVVAASSTTSTRRPASSCRARAAIRAPALTYLADTVRDRVLQPLGWEGQAAQARAAPPHDRAPPRRRWAGGMSRAPRSCGRPSLPSYSRSSAASRRPALRRESMAIATSNVTTSRVLPPVWTGPGPTTVTFVTVAPRKPWHDG